MTFLAELRRRKVVRTTIAYLVAAFVAAQVTQLLVDALELPRRLLKAFVILEIVAIPVVIALAWAFDMSRAGLHVTDGPAGRAAVPWRRVLVPAALAVALLLGFAWLLPRQAAQPERIARVAIMPFENLDGVAEYDYFSDGMREELATALTRIPGLIVAGRTSSYVFRDSVAPAERIGRALRVDALITATVRHAAERLRVTTQLVSTRDGTVLWDSVFESRSGDVFAVQDEFTRAIVAALLPALELPGPGALPENPLRGTTDVEAYDLYMAARYYWLERGEANVRRSIELFRQAIARDPQFARAHAGLALAYGTITTYVPDPTDSTTSLMERSARRALALSPQLADAHVALGMVHEDRLQLAEAAAQYRVAHELEPGNALLHHVYGMHLALSGRTEEGILQLRRATQIDPLAKSAGSGYALSLLYGRRYAEAREEARRVLAMDSTFVLGLFALSYAQTFGGQPDSAVSTIARAYAFHPDWYGFRPLLVFAHAAAGRWSEVERLRAELHGSSGDTGDQLASAFADLVAGDRLPLLHLLLTRPGQQAWYRLHGGFGCNPRLTPLWSDERFRQAMRAIGTVPCDVPEPLPWPARTAPR